MSNASVVLTIDDNTCKGCSLCESVCPKKIIVSCKDKLNAKGFHPVMVADPDKCIGCAFCAIMCPDTAIVIHKGP